MKRERYSQHISFHKTSLFSLSPSHLDNCINSRHSIWVCCQPCWPCAPGELAISLKPIFFVEKSKFLWFCWFFFKVFSERSLLFPVIFSKDSHHRILYRTSWERRAYSIERKLLFLRSSFQFRGWCLLFQNFRLHLGPKHGVLVVSLQICLLARLCFVFNRFFCLISFWCFRPNT